MNFKRITLSLLLGLLFLHSCGPCDDRPAPSLSPDVQEKEIRALFADILDTPAWERKENESTLKQAVLKYPAATYNVINHPQARRDAGIPNQMDAWIESFSESLKGVPYSKLMGALQTTAQDEFLKYEASLDSAIKDYDFKMVDALSHIEIPEALGKYFSQFLQNILTEYFPKLNVIDKRRILGSTLRNTTSKSSDTEVLLNVVYASGPFLQKLLQLLSEKMKPGDDPKLIALKDGLDNVKSGLPSIPKFYIARYLKELERDNVKLEIIRSLGAASVGEALLAKQIFSSDSDSSRMIVIKFMRPGVEEIARREDEFFKEQASHVDDAMGRGSDTMRRSFEQISEQIFDELDYAKEIQKLRRGAGVYGTDEGSPITVVKPIENFPKSKHWMAMEFATGKTYREARGKLTDKNQSLQASKIELMSKALLLDVLTREFIDKSFFLEPNGFFHGDLHEGNMIIFIHEDIYPYMDKHGMTGENLSKEDVQLLIKKKTKSGEPFIKLVLIDFGNAHYLPSNIRIALFNLVISAAEISLSPRAFLAAFQNISSEKQELDLETLENEIKPIFLNNKIKFHNKLGLALDILQQHDIFIPGIIVAFFRTLGMLEHSFEKLRNDADEHEFCFANLDIEAPIVDTIVSGIFSDALNDIKSLRLPDILSQENISAIGPNLLSHVQHFLKVKLGGWVYSVKDIGVSTNEEQHCSFSF